MEYLQYLQNMDWAMNLAGSDYTYPALLCAHAIGMGIVVGTMMMLSIRVLGYAKTLPVIMFDKLLTLSWWGVALNASSGTLLFILDGSRLVKTWSFQLKIALIIAGALSVWALWRTLRNEPLVLTAGADASGRAKTLAAITFLFWTGAVIAGRLIAYTLPIE